MMDILNNTPTVLATYK
jgi:hypothetical protein